MPSYTLEIEAFGVFATNAPSLEIWEDGVLDSTHLISATGSSIIVTINYPGTIPTSLALTFNDGFAAAGRTIEIQSVKINDKYVNVGNYLSSDSLTKGQSATVDIANSDFFYDASEPAAGTFTPATETFTAGNDSYRRPTDSDDEVFDMLGGRDVAYLGSGNDTVSGGAGNDYIRGGAGNDLLYGDADNDRIFGDDGDDLIYGGTGNDALLGGEGNDEIHGNDGDDKLHGNAGDDVITGGAGDDVITGGAGTNFLFGDAGNDYIIGDSGVDTIDGGDDDDILYGSGGNDFIDGGDGNDTLVGDTGDDILNGNDGNDILNGRDDNDELNGGAGDDILSGENGIDILDGGADDDVLVGGDGADTLNGGTGNDILHGSGLTGTEIYTILQANPNVVFNAATNSFYQYVAGTANYATALANAQAATLGGVSGHLVNITSDTENAYVTTLIGGTTWMGGTDNIVDGEWRWIGGAEDNAQFSDIAGNAMNNFFENWDAGQPQNNAEHNSVLYTNSTWHDWPDTASHRYVIEWDAGLISDDLAVDTLYGGDGNDFLYGYGGDDILDGEADNDVLFGGADDDLLTGGTGDDYLNGGDDDDVIVAGAAIAPTVDATTLLSYGGSQDGASTITYFPGGVTLDGNAWKRIALDYTVTANTVIEFDFYSTFEGEIHGIGFDTDNNISNNQTFQLYGTQNWGLNAFQNYDGSGNWAHYTIDVGSYFTGNFTHLIFTGDDDAGPLGNGTFANITIYESSGLSDDDTVDGGNGADQLFGNLGADTLNGGAGDDVISGNAGGDTLDGGADDDIVHGGEGNDTLSGGTGDDELYGGDGNDTLYGINATDSASSSVTDGTLNSQNANFNSGLDGYTYDNDPLSNGTGAYSNDSRDTGTGGLSNGALEIALGGVNNNTITNMAGIFSETFTKASATSNVYVQLSYRHVHTSGFEANEFSYALYDLNGSTTVLSTLTGDGNGGPDMDTGWTTVTIDFGVLAAGNHTLSVGSYLNQKTIADEESFVWFDDITWVEQEIGANTGTTNMLYGGDGLDTLYGSSETDIFVFENSTAFSDIDQIVNFNANEDDQLDISDILTGFTAGTDNISEFLQFTNSGGNSLIQVDTNGATGGFNYVTIGQLNGITDVDEVALYNAGNIIT